MELISRSQVPEYLQKGSFFEALPADLLRIEVPSKCLKADLSIQTDRDLSHLLHSVRFWKVHQVPDEVVEYIMRNVKKSVLDAVLPTCPNFKDHLSRMVASNIAEPVKTAVLTICLRTARNVVKILVEEIGRSVDGWSLVAVLDDVHSIPYLQRSNISIETTKFAHDAATAGSVGCLKFARAAGWVIPAEAVVLAAFHGQIGCVKYLHEDCGIPLTTDAIAGAAKAGKVTLIRYLQKKKCPWDARVCAILARENHLECLKFVHEKGCPWDEQTCSSAARGGHLRCLTYAHQAGCPWGGDTISFAESLNHDECLKYALKHCCPPPPRILARADAFYNNVITIAIWVISSRRRRRLLRYTASVTESLFNYALDPYEVRYSGLRPMVALPLFMFVVPYSIAMCVSIALVIRNFRFITGTTESIDKWAPTVLRCACVVIVLLHKIMWRVLV